MPPSVTFYSLDRERYRNDGSAIVTLRFANEHEEIETITIRGFKLEDYGSYDVGEPLEYSYQRIEDGS